MKRQTLTHPKLYRLMDELKVSRPEALGLLTLLWDFAASYSPLGDIGKWDDAAIARACDWTENASKLVDALIAAGWLDRHGTYRLEVHDWFAHCENWVKASVGKKGRSHENKGLRGSTQPQSSLEHNPSSVSNTTAVEESSQRGSDRLPYPIPSHPKTKTNTHPKPSPGQAKPSQAERSDAEYLARRIGTVVELSDQSAAEWAYDIALRTIRGDLSKADVEAAIEAVRSNKPDKPRAYFSACILKRMNNL